jgi:tRNA pseudouridine32 synthase/23S rRNA pseudouridine746 synthase
MVYPPTEAKQLPAPTAGGPSAQPSARPEPGRRFILHADDHIVVVDKPAGLPSVPGRAPGLQDCAAVRVQSEFPDALVVHRLDMATSGLLVLARGPQAQRILSRAFEQRQIGKRYEAWVGGVPLMDGGTIDLPLAADWPHRPRQRVDVESGKQACTHWTALERAADRCRLELEPVTGRSHQLRVHLAAIGHPILGDPLYAPPRVQALASRLCLHATRLEMKHPQTGLRVIFVSEPPF